jgi:hypothetical protein
VPLLLVIANIVLRSRYIPEDDILRSHRRENQKSYTALTGWSLKRRRNVSPVKYELGFYIPEDDILHSHRHEKQKSYTALTGWSLYRRSNVSPVKYEDDILHSHRREKQKSYTCSYCSILPGSGQTFLELDVSG